MSKLFNLGLNQKGFGGNHKIQSSSINMGATKGRGSTSRKFNYCKQHSQNPYLCINEFITLPQNPVFTSGFVFSFDFAGQAEPSNSDIFTNLPILNVNNSFSNISINSFVSGTVITIQMNYTYTDSGSDDGLTFAYQNMDNSGYVYAFYNNYTNLTILNFGDIPLSRNSLGISSGYGQFSGVQGPTGISNLTNIIFNTNTAPTILYPTHLSGTFAGMIQFNSNLSNWDTTNVVDLTFTFVYCSAFNNGDASGNNAYPLNWNTSNVYDLVGTFAICNSFNQYVGNWDTGNVNTMQYTFYVCTDFNNGSLTNDGANPLNWNTNNVVNMEYMFGGSPLFNQPLTYDPSLNPNIWNTTNVTLIDNMFNGATSFNNGYASGDNTHPMNWIITNVSDSLSFGTDSLLTFYPTPGTSNNNMFSSW